LVDQSRFDEQFVPPAFDQQPTEWSTFRAPVSAIALERNSVTLNVLPQQPGQPARVWFEPLGFVDVSGAVETRAAGAGQGVRLTLVPQANRLRAAVSGHIAAGLPRQRLARRVDDPRLFAGWVLRELLKDLGVDVKGGVRLGGEAEKRRLVWVDSAPLSTLLLELGKHSDNFYAEMILKTLGAEAGLQRGRPARSADGAEVVRSWLAEAGALEPDTRIVNGSGLFDANRVSTLSLARALRFAYRDPAISSEFVAQLAVGGADGTLHGRFRRHRTRRIVRAKTGTLRDVVALSGYVLAPPGRSPVAFSLIVVRSAGNHPETRSRVDSVVDRIAAELWQ
jgi:D-alanyl-D-alanine carboxypeptidase/D-alanyl-D-alanine-endopeptidase (penicillin-binding protein 4)